MEGLTEGRMVHYCWGNHCRAAVVTYVWNKERGVVNLHVFKDGSHPEVPETPTSVLYSEVPQERTWHWIEKA
jgi:hypothetical protein